jgi:hypothetical protein
MATFAKELAEGMTKPCSRSKAAPRREPSALSDHEPAPPYCPRCHEPKAYPHHRASRGARGGVRILLRTLQARRGDHRHRPQSSFARRRVREGAIPQARHQLRLRRVHEPDWYLHPSSRSARYDFLGVTIFFLQTAGELGNAAEENPRRRCRRGRTPNPYLRGTDSVRRRAWHAPHSPAPH